MRCPYCGASKLRVIDTTPQPNGVRRRRLCTSCNQRFSTFESPIMTLPLIVKKDGTREEFNPNKLERGIRIACAKRPVSAEAIRGIVRRVEDALQKQGRAEVPSRVIGDLVIAELKALDQIAYIRYAIVYLRLDDLHALRREIDRLLEGK